MSRISDLIQELCPDGVPFRALGDIAELQRGQGMPRAMLVSEGVGAVHYGDIYTQYGHATRHTINFISPGDAERLVKVYPGDVIVTNTSENIEDVCSSLAWLGEGSIVTGGHSTVIRSQMDASFVSYWFRSSEFAKLKRKLATGTKVIEITANSLKKVRIPVPPIEVQREIVRILDQFTQLEAELEAELERRRLQFEHYRDSLMTFTEGGRWTTMGEVGYFFGGLTGKTKQDFGRGQSKFITYMDVFHHPGLQTGGSGDVLILDREKQNLVHRGDVLFTGSSESREEVGLTAVILEEPETDTYLNSFCIGFRFNRPELFDLQFLKFLLRSSAVRRQLMRSANGVTRINLSRVRLNSIRLPLIDVDEQRTISQTLSALEQLTFGVTTGIPAEIAARRKQYEYYRDQLLTFKELPA